MYLSYLDASGRPSFTDSENFVLASITVNEHQWYSIRKMIEEIKEKHFPQLRPENVEFHAKDMMNRKGIYKNVSWTNIYKILDDVFGTISHKDTTLTIIASLIKKDQLHKRIDVEEWGYRFLFERLNRYLIGQNELLAEVGNPHEYGIMIMDSEGHKKDQILRDKLYTMLNKGTYYSQLDYLIEDPLFTDSKWRNLSQIVDCVAYCIRKKFRNNTDNSHTTSWLGYYSMIEKKFHNVDGNYSGIGLKIFP